MPNVILALTWPETSPKNSFFGENPEKYKEAQKYGEFLMNTRFFNTKNYEIEKEDIEGNNILFNEIVNKKNYYNLSIDDLLDYEIEIIKKKYGHNDWKDKFENFILKK